MPHRAASPALSENAFDISSALLAQSDDSESENGERNVLSSKAEAPKASSALAGAEDSSDEEFIAMAQAAANRKASNIKGRTVKKGGGFQAMGLNHNLLKAITRKGFSVPTPIQRKAIPLILAGTDVCGMARTGSGKTAAFVIPLIEKLKQSSGKFGVRALILSPSRELALQTLKVVRELSKGTDLKSTLLVGGESLEEQFGLLSSAMDIVVATPGRFFHLKTEMGLDISSIHYVVFDEADRLFELGFEQQLNGILHSLPQSRQTLLFSATLPKSLVEFAKAGLQEPRLVRLDSESKISPDLQTAFFTVKSADKEGSLLHILQEVIRIPTGPTKKAKAVKAAELQTSKKRKRGDIKSNPNESPTEHSTIIFTATKHHVDYLAFLLKSGGWATSYVYGSLDQTARKIQVEDFRTGLNHILVTTDVAARGIDIPILANVINYDFPPQPKIFVHRVGRTARAGQRGWSFSLVTESDCPYLLDLQLFLGKKLVLGRGEEQDANYTNNLVVGALPRDKVAASSEWVGKLLDEDTDMASLRSVAVKGEKLYKRTRNSASTESAKRAKQITASRGWVEVHPLFTNDVELEREDMLAVISGFRPQETVFEIGNRSTQGEVATVVRKRRAIMEAKRHKEQATKGLEQQESDGDVEMTNNFSAPANESSNNLSDPEENIGVPQPYNSDSDSDDLEITISDPSRTKPLSSKAPSKTATRDDENYMSYTPQTSNPTDDAGYSVNSHSASTSSFLTAARHATLDLAPDERTAFGEPSRPSALKWDRRHKKYVARDAGDDGRSNNKSNKSEGDKKFIRGESGSRIAASFRSGRFEAWKRANRLDRLPRVGEAQKSGANPKSSGPGPNNGPASGGGGGRRFKHRLEKAPKDADKFRDDFHTRKKRVAEAKEKRVGRFREGEGRSEVRDLQKMKKERAVKMRRREKTGRHRR